MWNRRYENPNYGGASVSRELEAIQERKEERERKEELMLQGAVEVVFDDKLFNSLKKILLKVTKTS